VKHFEEYDMLHLCVFGNKGFDTDGWIKVTQNQGADGLGTGSGKTQELPTFPYNLRSTRNDPRGVAKACLSIYG
jgi:hypothetical protein